MHGEPSIDGLIQAIANGSAYDQLQLALNPHEWREFAQALQPMSVQVGHVLIERGGTDRVAYLIESGVLSAHIPDGSGRMRLAVLNPGTVAGEGGFLSAQPRSASVITTSAGRVWCLSIHRFEDLALRSPQIALLVAWAFGSVAVRRCNHPTQRLAVT